MKTKSASQSAFFNLRILTGLFLVLTGVFLALLGFGGFSVQAQEEKEITAKSLSALVPPGFDCSKIREMGIDKQENFRSGAIMIFCHEAEGGSASPSDGSSNIIQKLLGPLAFGNADVDLVTGTETPPHIVQSETFTTANPDNPLQVVVAYNDSRGANSNNISGASVSTDGGTTFTRVTTASGQSPFANTFGDPVVLYNKPTGTWFTVWLDAQCGGQGLGGYKSTNPSDPTSWTHYCVHNGGSDDRESGFADNNPSSPFFGRMYVSWNDFAAGQGIFVRFSTDNGATWTNQRQVTTTFIRNVQITGDLATGDVYIAGMNEGGGGFPHNDTNNIYRSTDGGNTWTPTYTGPPFAGPGVTAVGYFACMFPDGGGYWRHEGWGEPAAFNHVVHLVYAQHGAGADPGDVYYIRSTDMGVTFGAPLKLNTDATTRPQWQPNLSVSPTGTLLATWYDARESASCTKGNPAVPCYRMFSRKSNDNGVSWLPDDTLSDVVSPLPGQSDPNIVTTYVGDYDYGSAVLVKHVTSWADGRVAIGGASQQDAFTDREPVGFGVSTTNPACGSIINTQPTDFVVNVSDPVNPATVQASDFTVNGIAANSFVLSNGNATITFHFNSSPVTVQGVQTMAIPAGAFNRASDNMPNFAFTCTFRYDAVLLQVTTTVPAVGGTFSPPAPGDYTYDVNFSEAVDPTSVQIGDLTVTGNAGVTVTGVSLINANMTARFTLHMNFGGSLTANIAAGAITDPFGNPNAAFSGSYTVTGCPPQDHYNITQIGGSIVAGTTDSGNHGDDVVTTISLPFSYSLYDTNYTSINVSSNGNAQFVTMDTAFTNSCLPWTTHNYTVFPYWDDLRTDVVAGTGIFTSITGSAPNRIFNIEWRASYFSGAGSANFELRLYEGQSRFDVIYGTVDQGNTGATAGVQKNNTAFDQYFCDGAGGGATGGQSYMIQSCGTPTPTPTATATSTGTPSPTPTATAACTPSYTTTTTTGTITAGGTDIGNHCDDCSTQINLPFPVSVYGNPPISVASVGSDGDIHFVTAPYNKLFWWMGCVPVDPGTGQDPFLNTFFPNYADLRTDANPLQTCTDCGIFTQTLGTAPNRQFVIRWKTTYFDFAGTAEFEVLLTEGSNTLSVIYGATADNGLTAVSGIQQDLTLFTSFSCDEAALTPGVRVNYIPTGCGSPTPTPTPSGTPSPTPTCIPAPSWSAGPNMPPVGAVRAPGNYFPANGRFYAIGGRSADTAGSDFTNPFEYNPATNTWVTKAATYPDNQVNNMACGVLTVGGTPQVYCVGGSAAGATVATARVFSYNPVTDTITTLTAPDNWPGNTTGTILPGGFAVAGNKLYIIGGFNIGVASTAQTWQFDPTAAVGSRWLQRLDYPVARSYIPAASIAGLIYTGGGSNIVTTTVTDTAESFKYDPAANTWTAIANIPRATGETRAVVINNQMWVLGGGRTAPNPSNEVDIYTPGSNTWTTGLPFTTARRNFPADTDGSHIWLAGGYDTSGTTLLNTMEIYSQGVCPTPTPGGTPTPTPSGTPTPTPTATPTATATATATATPVATPTPAGTPTPTPTITPGGTPTPTPTPGGTPSPTPGGTPSPTPGGTPSPTPAGTPTPIPAAQTVNLSTRMLVQTGANVGIGGFIITGSAPKRVIVRAIGPSLSGFGVPNPLADPVLELHGPAGFVTIINNNWRDTQEAEIIATGIPPTNNLESAIVANLAPGAYTAIVRGNNNTTGVALVEVYDLDPAAASQLANISTRAFVSTGADVVIAGFILGSGSGMDNIIVRGIGPSLTAFGVPNALANPTLELHNANGALILSNNNWQDDPVQAALITAAGLAPTNTLESAIAATLAPSQYTAVLAGQNNGTGVGLVEVYDLGNGGPVPTPTPGGTPAASPTPGGTPSPTPAGSPSPTPAASPSPSPTTCIENFDGVTAPALPAGWVATNPDPGDGTLWVTDTVSFDSAPNDAFIPDQDGISDKVLDSRNIAITSAGAVISFRNYYNTEYDPPPMEVFWDGGVLEVSSPNISGGDFLDFTDPLVGGSFVSGGYTGEISGVANNPLAGRMAWCGDSGGYINSVANLGPNVAGQTIKLRFRMGTDEAAARPGWRVDTISITNASCP